MEYSFYTSLARSFARVYEIIFRTEQVRPPKNTLAKAVLYIHKKIIVIISLNKLRLKYLLTFDQSHEMQRIK